MGKTRSSALFAAAYIALVVGLFLALGGAAYAQSPATNQYGGKVKGVQVSATAESNSASTAAESQALPTPVFPSRVAHSVALGAGGLYPAPRETEN